MLGTNPLPRRQPPPPPPASPDCYRIAIMRRDKILPDSLGLKMTYNCQLDRYSISLDDHCSEKTQAGSTLSGTPRQKDIIAVIIGFTMDEMNVTSLDTTTGVPDRLSGLHHAPSSDLSGVSGIDVNDTDGYYYNYDDTYMDIFHLYYGGADPNASGSGLGDLDHYLGILNDTSNFLPPPLGQAMRNVLLISFIFIIVLSVLGNSLVIIVVARHKKMQTVTNAFLLSLAVSDLLIAAVNMPVQLRWYLYNEWTLSEAMCKFSRYLQGVVIVVSILTLTGIAADRRLSILADRTRLKKKTPFCNPSSEDDLYRRQKLGESLCY
ncbi:hypothetical protein LSH36_26g13030 [Paralvinella palmiformis]|uniref:G-protein coupled receptors family 1 profile domain-containing protein n=1 Tax=Paralvinella palmiformis TaxID=53620 RepID=A0AAD9KAC7_9ANNE|nr:hypothetical protein LSH36_26g13030 [Paralvinella palmiformis]